MMTEDYATLVRKDIRDGQWFRAAFSTCAVTSVALTAWCLSNAWGHLVNLRSLWTLAWLGMACVNAWNVNRMIRTIRRIKDKLVCDRIDLAEYLREEHDGCA